MKLFYAAAAAALAKHASAYRVVYGNDEKYCLLVVKNDGSTDWDVDVNGAITGLPSSSTVTTDADGSPTVAQNGVNDPTGAIKTAADGDWPAFVTAWTATGGPGNSSPEYSNDLTITIYEAGGAAALSSLSGLTAPSGTLNWCQSYSTMAPEHYCKADGAFKEWQSGTVSSGTLEDCCESNHGGQMSMQNACIKVSTGVVAKGDAEWYVDYSNHKCVRNCDVENLFKPDTSGSLTLWGGSTTASYAYECGGLVSWGNTWTDIADCCSNTLASLQPTYCEYKSQGGSASPPLPAEYAGTSEWYSDASNSLCKKDCAEDPNDLACGGTIKDASVELFTTAANCCSDELSWLDATGCSTRSANGEGEPTDLYWAAPDGCKQDCTGQPNCATAPTSAKLYATEDDCCKKANSWVDLDYCTSRAAPAFDESNSQSTGSDKWYVDYEDGVCHQDCYPDSNNPQCEWADNGSMTFFDSQSACCKAALASNDQEACVAGSTQGLTISTVPTNKWYVSSNDQPCAQDCATGGTNTACGGIVSKTGVRLYDSEAECCDQAYGWLNDDLCQAESANAGASTDLWYVDYGANACKKDCTIAAANPECDGRPDDITTPLYSTAAACCHAKLSWIDKDTCETSSTTGVDPTDSDSPGTGEWRKNSSWNSCVLDCTAGNTIETGDPILTVQPLTTAQFGVTPAPSPLQIGNDYPEQCDGVISDSSAVFYDGSVSNCCKSINWVQEETCISISTDVVSEMFFVDPSDNTKCVVQQEANTAGPTITCDGNGEISAGSASTGVTGVTCKDEITPSTKLYSTLEKCCEANVNWDEEGCFHASRGTEATGTSKWYVDWSNEQCVQDCSTQATGSSCGGIAKPWDVLYSDSSSCCNRLSWLSRSKCIYVQT